MIRLFSFFIFLGIIFSGNAQENTASKNVSTFTIEAPQLKTTKKIWIYLPENYTASDQKYSVIYMHDAQNLFDAKTSYVGKWNVDEKLDSLKAKVIVVGIEHGNDKRIDELTPFKSEKYGGGNADNYLDFIVKTVKPYIDKNYRTKTKAKNTIIMGSSLGGLVSYYAILKYPEVFGKAAVFSPSFWFSKDIYTLTEKTTKIKIKIYFLCGDKEDENMVQDMTKMERLLDTKRCYCLHLTKSKIVKGGEHNEKLWRDGFVGALSWLKY
ncbi:alpha/beta hydrolase [Flavobacterium circumlabens]|uniref:Alpha/beta hydrolase n=1 Tax=Flavobacterium circumlabens TaxID=2133765 RepID=A0A4Y7UBM4_9FLAO|nr:alpha/beta hydrolase-fold protein [Flavobacterium circumlabens]TCN57541.1 putative alpha/beta superfamily hydrolase [Flavobacterium circumlabens]TEB43853.1 alpha/beta hydrolase [Flavobacterium circumlabens]